VEPKRRKFLSRLALAGFAALCAGWLATLDFARKVSTDVLDLLPTAEQSPEAALVRSLAGDTEARVMLFALGDPAAPGTPPAGPAREFAAELSRSPAFAEAVSLADGDARNDVGRAIFERRLQLLLPTWLGRMRREFAGSGRPAGEFSAWLAERSASRLEAFLARPEAMAMQDIVASDPLLLVPDFAQVSYQLAARGAGAGGRALVWARIRASPLSEEGQGPVFLAIDRAFASLRAGHPGIEMQWSGVNRFAAAGRARIQSELGMLNGFSVAAVLAVGCALVRRMWKMLHLVPVILLSLLGAWAASTLVFGRIHILVFVIGSLLSGVAVDYGFYIYMQPPLRPDEPYSARLRRLLKPLLASCLTTVIGFSLLGFSDLPVLRELGLFVAAGLLCALGSAMLYFAQLERPLLEARSFGRPRPVPAGPVRDLFLLALAVAVLGPWRLRWRDDVRDLEIASPKLEANDRALRALFGDTPDQGVFLTHGASIAEARRHLDEFIAYEARSAPSAAPASLGLAFPTEEDWQALPGRIAGLASFAADFREALGRHGFDAGSFSGFFTDWEALRAHPPAGPYDALYSNFSSRLKGPFALFYHADGPMRWFLTVVSHPGGAAPAPPAGLNTVGVGQLESLNSLFARYRWSALRLSLAGLALVIASVFAIYRGRRAVRIALIPAGSCFLVFGVYGLLGQTLNLFHLLGAFLGVCLSHNYAIFSSETAARGAPPFVSVRLSALCAATSFGVLGFSRIPVIHALGLTVASIVLTALAAVEIEPLARRPA